MREEGLTGTPRRKFRGTTTDSAHEQPIAPDLLKRQFIVDEADKAWVGDITCLPVVGGWVYLAVLIDSYSRKVVGWALGDDMETGLCLEALRQAIATRVDVQGTGHHTDRGSQHGSIAYHAALADNGMEQNMSRKGNCWDKAVAESFFGTLEQELVSDQSWADAVAARNAVADYIHKSFDPVRRHATLGYVSPVAFESTNQAAGRQAA